MEGWVLLGLSALMLAWSFYLVRKSAKPEPNKVPPTATYTEDYIVLSDEQCVAMIRLAIIYTQVSSEPLTEHNITQNLASMLYRNVRLPNKSNDEWSKLILQEIQTLTT